MASNDEFYAAAAQKRLNQINQQRLRAQHDLALSLSQGDEEDAANEIQQIANLENEQANLIALAQREMARQNPPAPPRQTGEQLRAKPAEQMTPEDGLEIARRSKYGKNLDWNDANVVAGWNEVHRRRQRGENQR